MEGRYSAGCRTALFFEVLCGCAPCVGPGWRARLSASAILSFPASLTPRALCLLVEVCVQTCVAGPSSRASAGAHPKPPLFPRGERSSRSSALFGLERSGACIDPLIVRGLRLTSLLPGKPSPWRPSPLPQRRIVNSCRQRPGSLGRGPPRPGAQGERLLRRGPI